MSEPRVLAGRYEMGEVIGRGGMATVSRAKDLRLSRDVAVKELRPDLASDATFQERFRREAQAAAGLNHPTIVSVFDTGEQVDPATGVSVPFIVMELVSGRTLRDLLRDGRPLLPSKAIELTIGVLDALEYSHKAGIVHRDIKPANVMLTASGQVKVMDFGIARAVADTSSTMTSTAAVIGTAQYLSPEQARGETVDARSDLYSTGCLLYELLVGRPPFTGESPVSVAYQHVREQATPPSQLDSEITPAMDAVVMKSLAKNPADRYQTARAMSDDLKRILAGDQTQAGTEIVAPPVPVPVPAAAGASAATTVLPAYADATATGPIGALAFEEDPPKRRSGGWVWPVVTGLLLLALVAGTAFVITGLANGQGLQFPWAQRKVTVPSIVKMQQAAAETSLHDRGLTPDTKQVQGPDDTTVGTVTTQDPPANTQVAPNSIVHMTVNIGPAKVILPVGILGKDATAVKQSLEAQGFTVDVQNATTEAPTDTAGRVLAVTPAEGSLMPVGQHVVLTVATGKAQVPNLSNLSRDLATQSAKAAGFTNLSWEPKTSSNVPADNVVDTNPTAFSMANKADKLTIYYAVAPVTTTTTTTTTAPPQTSTAPAQTSTTTVAATQTSSSAPTTPAAPQSTPGTAPTPGTKTP